MTESPLAKVPDGGTSAPVSSGAGRARSASQEADVGSWSYRLVWAATIVLLLFGLLMVLSASSVVGLFRENPDGFYYLRQQAIIAGGGIMVVFALSRIDYRRLRPYIGLALGLSVALLLLMKLPGAGRDAGGATRWLDLGLFSVQPSEVAKLAMVGFGAHVLSTKRALKGTADRLLLPLGPVMVGVCLLIVSQPDLGTTVMVATTALAMLWVAGLPLRHWLAISGMGSVLGMLLILTADYRRERLLAFLDPSADPQGSGFQIIQSLVAIGSGGLFGVGPGRSIQKFSYLPEAHTDMIFAIIGEEFGLMGIGVVIGIFGVFTASAWRIATGCRDPFGKYLAAGALFLIVGQAILNFGGVLAVLPLTGVPLPFISFGRTNLLIVLAATGLILSVARYGPVAETRAPHGDRSWDEQNDSSRGTTSNVAYLDRRRRHGRARRAGLGHS